jgi:tetratricopeptide (TPR) repeat protein
MIQLERSVSSPSSLWRALPIGAILLLTPLVAFPAFQDAGVGLRIIVVDTESEAASIRARAVEGEPFDALALAYSTDPSGPSGGYLGTLRVADLATGYQTAIRGLGPGQISPVTLIGNDYVLLQVLSEAESNWITRTASGLQAFEEGRFEDAEVQLTQAVRDAASLGEADYRLNVALSTLAGVHRARENYREAERLYRQALEVIERAVGANDPDYATGLANLARLFREEGNYAVAETLLDQSQTILVDAFGPNHPNVALGFTNLARLRRAQGNFDRAESLYAVALSILEQALGPDAPAVADTLYETAALIREAGRPAEASALETRAAAIRAAPAND